MIEPRLASGLRDYLPKDMILRQKMFDVIRASFERFGFLPLDTPGIEKEEILTGGDPGFNKKIFRTSTTGTREFDLALRFDLTVPLARVVASYPNDIPRPFKRYQTGKVWRGEKPQAGRFREFVQFDADIVGSKSMMADAEIISLMYETMKALGFDEFLIRVNNRKILNGLAAYAGFEQAKNEVVLRTIDKLDKLSWDGVAEELRRSPGDRNDPGAGLAELEIEAIRRFLDVRGDSSKQTLQNVRSLMSNSPEALEGVSELSDIVDYAEALGVPDDKFVVDLSVARGLGYYTGPVFETVLTAMVSLGSVFSGGRYDDLVSRFSSSSLPATGASVGVDRLYAAMELQQGKTSAASTLTKVMLLDFAPECRILVQKAATDLRRAGVPTEVYLGQEVTLKAQLSSVIKQGVPCVVLIGNDERLSGKFKVKDMAKRTQVEVGPEELVDLVNRLLRDE